MQRIKFILSTLSWYTRITKGISLLHRPRPSASTWETKWILRSSRPLPEMNPGSKRTIQVEYENTGNSTIRSAEASTQVLSTRSPAHPIPRTLATSRPGSLPWLPSRSAWQAMRPSRNTGLIRDPVPRCPRRYLHLRPDEGLDRCGKPDRLCGHRVRSGLPLRPDRGYHRGNLRSIFFPEKEVISLFGKICSFRGCLPRLDSCSPPVYR